jgi:hypothetical protein
MHCTSPFGRRLAVQISGARDRRALRRASLLQKLGIRFLRFTTWGLPGRLGHRASVRRGTTRLPCPARERRSEVMVRPHQGRHIPATIAVFEPFLGMNPGKPAFTRSPGVSAHCAKSERIGTTPAAPPPQITNASTRHGARRSHPRNLFPASRARTSTLLRTRLIRHAAESPHAATLVAPHFQQSMTCPAKCLLTLPTRKRLGWSS